MDLSIREAAALVGRSPRAIRQWIASGRLPARKSGRSWLVRVEQLPLTDAQRARVGARADEARGVVEGCLPSRAAATRTRRRRSLLDLDAFRIARQAVRELEQAAGDLCATHDLRRAAAYAHRAVLRLGEGVHEFELPRKAARLNAARRGLAHSVALIHAAQDVPHGALLSPLERIEQEVMPLIGGLLRWSRQAPRSRRR
jgi:excisionase family DNA binding protein